MMDGFCIDAPNYAFLIASIKFTIRIYLHHIHHNNNTTYSHTCAIMPFLWPDKICVQNEHCDKVDWVQMAAELYQHLTEEINFLTTYH